MELYTPSIHSPSLHTAQQANSSSGKSSMEITFYSLYYLYFELYLPFECVNVTILNMNRNIELFFDLGTQRCLFISFQYLGYYINKKIQFHRKLANLVRTGKCLFYLFFPY